MIFTSTPEICIRIVNPCIDCFIWSYSIFSVLWTDFTWKLNLKMWSILIIGLVGKTAEIWYHSSIKLLLSTRLATFCWLKVCYLDYTRQIDLWNIFARLLLFFTIFVYISSSFSKLKKIILHSVLRFSLFNIFKSQKDPILLINQELWWNIELFVSIQENNFSSKVLQWPLQSVPYFFWC